LIKFKPIKKYKRYLKRRHEAKYEFRKIENDEKLRKYIVRKLKKFWSPEQIAGRLKFVEHPNDPSWHICHETIYEYIYSGKWINQKTEPLCEYLRRKQKKRYKKGGRSVQRASKIPDRVSIHDRPKEVDERVVPGHWEGDSIVGRKKLEPASITIVVESGGSSKTFKNAFWASIVAP